MASRIVRVVAQRKSLLKSLVQNSHQHCKWTTVQRCLSTSQQLFNDRRYSEKHEWASIEKPGSLLARVGISQYAQEALGDVVYVQLPEVNQKYSTGEEVGAVESVKAASEIYTPIAGTVMEINKALEDKPGLVNISCYDEGWLFKIEMTDENEFKNLMDESSYQDYLKQLKN